MSGSYFQPIKREFLNLSGGTVTGGTIFTQNLSANTFYSGSTNLEDVIRSINTQGSFLPLTGGTGGAYNLTGSTTASTLFISTLVEPVIDNSVDIGSTFKRFRELNIINGVSVNFTATTRIDTPEIKLGTMTITDTSIILTGQCIDGGDW